ncbi:MAG TPA: hypothetical protein VFS34_14780 [Thermoanaerobaculia bacterium]|nr:hypothetical protein [Thermoanaerobaculia bacterium]
MVDAGDLQQRLLLRLAGGISPEDLSAWARGVIAFDAAEGPALFAGDDEILRDVLKRCAIAAEEGFEMGGEEIRRLLRRVAYSAPGLEPRGRREGPFLVAMRARMVPARAYPLVGNCARCGAAVRVSEKSLSKALRSRGVLACVWCARSLPGTVVEAI